MTAYNDMGIADLTFSASGDMSSNQYKFMKMASTAKRVLLANGASNPGPIGILQNDPLSGEPASVKVWGTTQVWFSGSANVSYGDFLVSGSAGGAEKAALCTANAIALETITAGSGYIEALVFPMHFSVMAANV